MTAPKPERWGLHARYRTHKTGMWFAGYESDADKGSTISFTNQKAHAWKFHSVEAAKDRAKALRDNGYTVIVHKL